MSDALRMTGVTLAYDSQPVLTDVCLEVAFGSLHVFRGPSGAGKSTLLRASAGLLPASTGEIWRGVRKVAWVPQAQPGPFLHPESVAEVVRGVSSLRGKSGAAAVDSALDSLGLSGLANERYSSLSGGQRQRVLVARAEVSGARIVVMDEPTSALDASSANLVRDAMDRAVDRGCAVLCATHRAMAMAKTASVTYTVDAGTMTLDSALDPCS